jgi:hypothetical protein
VPCIHVKVLNNQGPPRHTGHYPAHNGLVMRAGSPDPRTIIPVQSLIVESDIVEDSRLSKVGCSSIRPCSRNDVGFEPSSWKKFIETHSFMISTFCGSAEGWSGRERVEKGSAKSYEEEKLGRFWIYEP